VVKGIPGDGIDFATIIEHVLEVGGGARPVSKTYNSGPAANKSIK